MRFVALKQPEGELVEETAPVLAHMAARCFSAGSGWSGRLIRSEEDRGIVVVVEGRTDRRYFRQSARALPPDTQIRVARRNALPGILEETGLGGPVDGL